MADESLEPEIKAIVAPIAALIPPYFCRVCGKHVSLATKCEKARFDEYHIAIQSRNEYWVTHRLEEIFGENCEMILSLDMDFKPTEDTSPTCLLIGDYDGTMYAVRVENRELGLNQIKLAKERNLFDFFDNCY